MSRLFTAIVTIILFGFLFSSSVSVSYNPSQSLDFLYYAKASYCPEKQLKTWSCGPSCTKHPNMKDVVVYLNYSHEAQGFSGYNADTKQIVVAFRGSSNAINWWNNFKFFEVNYPFCSGCKIHKGFQVTYDDIGPKIMKNIASLIQKYGSGSQFVVTGHSLGGALAVLCAADIYRAYSRVNYLYTYGTPRAGNTAFATYMHQALPNAIRVTHFKDPVPHLPFEEILKQNYLQVPTEVWYNTQDYGDGSKFKVCTMSSVQEDPNCSDSVLCDRAGDHNTYMGIPTSCNNGEGSLDEDQEIGQDNIDLNNNSDANTEENIVFE